MSRRSTALFSLLAAAGLVLYLWPALVAPVVLWSDSELDLAWARQGVGIVGPIPPPAPDEPPLLHSAKPGWLLFLRVVLVIAPESRGPRAVVVFQSLLLWASIVFSAFVVARRHDATAGIVLLVVLLTALRLRDSASAVMPEALSAALLLPIALGILELPRRRAALVLFGVAIAGLFWVRPNVGGVALMLAVAVAGRRASSSLPLLAGFFLLVLPVWIATRPRAEGEGLRGLAHAIVFGSAEYGWVPSVGTFEASRTRGDIERREIEQARRNWNALLRGRGPDVRRQIVWRAAHGLLGAEFADPRWSTGYGRAFNVSRIVTPFLTLGAIALLLGAGAAGLPGLVLVLALVAQNVLLLSSPRFVLPFLPALYLFAAVAAGPLFSGGSRRKVRFATLSFAVLLSFAALNPYVLDWEWGRIESAGVKIRQPIPRGALPASTPATLHVRIAPPIPSSAAHLEIRGPGGERLYSSTGDPDRTSPAVTVALPASVLEANSRGAIELELSSLGGYGAVDYLMFPVVPPPWTTRAKREGSDSLSPSTGIRAGSLDWWAHAGAETVSGAGR